MPVIPWNALLLSAGDTTTTMAIMAAPGDCLCRFRDGNDGVFSGDVADQRGKRKDQGAGCQLFAIPVKLTDASTSKKGLNEPTKVTSTGEKAEKTEPGQQSEVKSQAPPEKEQYQAQFTEEQIFKNPMEFWPSWQARPLTERRPAIQRRVWPSSELLNLAARAAKLFVTPLILLPGSLCPSRTRRLPRRKPPGMKLPRKKFPKKQQKFLKPCRSSLTKSLQRCHPRPRKPKSFRRLLLLKPR